MFSKNNVYIILLSTFLVHHAPAAALPKLPDFLWFGAISHFVYNKLPSFAPVSATYAKGEFKKLKKTMNSRFAEFQSILNKSHIEEKEYISEQFKSACDRVGNAFKESMDPFNLLQNNFDKYKKVVIKNKDAIAALENKLKNNESNLKTIETRLDNFYNPIVLLKQQLEDNKKINSELANQAQLLGQRVVTLEEKTDLLIKAIFQKDQIIQEKDQIIERFKKRDGSFNALKINHKNSLQIGFNIVEN